MKEQQPPLPPELSPEVVDYLSTRDVAATLVTTGEGTALVVFAPDRELAAITGEVPVGVAPELHLTESAPVIRFVTRLFDVPDDPLVFEAFIDPGDPEQRAQFAALTEQETLPILLYGHDLDQVARTELPIPQERGRELGTMLAHAEAWVRGIPRGGYDFAEAKDAVIAQTEHPELPYR